jgi:DNA topoisomerase IA
VVSIVTAERVSLTRAQSNQRIEYQSIESQARAKRALPKAKCPLRRDADLVDAGLARCRFDTID